MSNTDISVIIKCEGCGKDFIIPMTTDCFDMYMCKNWTHLSILYPEKAPFMSLLRYEKCPRCATLDAVKIAK